MADSAPPTRHSLQEIADTIGGRLIDGSGDGVAITGVNTLQDAGPGDITFIADSRHAPRWPGSRAAAAIVAEGVELPADSADPPRPVIGVPSAELAIAAVLELFAPPEPLPDEGVHPSAIVDSTAELGEGVRIGPHAVVGPGCRLGAGVVLHAHAVLYDEVVVGDGTVLHAGVVVRSRCRIGRRCILHPNVSIGADGFGYRPADDGSSLIKMPHIGNVVIGDDVEIGAGSAIDRAKFGSTTIGEGTKIDNLVQIGHNCRIGAHVVIAALTGLAGSVTVGDWTQIGGGVVIADHVTVGKQARIGGGSGLMADVPDGGSVLGRPAQPHGETLRQWAAMRKLPRLIQSIRELERPAGEA